jgi:hypothetical protein
MYCPQCGTESPQDQRFCRTCGANLKVIGKAVALSEAVARSDRGPLPVIKEMMKSIKIEHTTEEISNALEQMNVEITRNFSSGEASKKKALKRKEEASPEQRRENHVVQGAASLFSGIALMIFLYYFSASLVLKVPPEDLAKIPFELEPVVKIAWMLGLMPALSGLGKIIAGLLVRSARPALNERKEPDPMPEAPAEAALSGGPRPEAAPASVIERTTELLDRKAAARRGH